MNIFNCKANILAPTIRIIMATMLIIICTKIKIPLNPVPIVLTSVAINFIGIRYNFYEATLSVLLYLAIGSTGVPIFASASSSIAGPTGGYLIGYLISVMVMTKFKQAELISNNVISDVATSALGVMMIYAPGVIWLSKFVGGYEQAIQLGLYPFILVGIAKIFILCFILKLTGK